MSFRSILSVSLPISVASALAFGCGGAAVSGGSDENAVLSSALEATNGGLDERIESANFGDPAVLETVDFAGTLGTTSMETASVSSTRAYAVALIWGHLPDADDASAPSSAKAPKPIDWTGTVSVSKGQLDVARTVAFDPHDSLGARTEPNVVSFVSHTLPAIDGLIVRVKLPEGAPHVLSFATKALSTSLDLDAIAKSEGLATRVDDRNGMFAEVLPHLEGCAGGFVVGDWTKDKARIGHLRGRVVSAAGAPLGHVKGLWGHSQRRDDDVFFGKYITPTGAFRGLFGGHYGNGAFDGQWHLEGAEHGRLAGLYSDGAMRPIMHSADAGAPPASDAGRAAPVVLRGFFLGKWREACTADGTDAGGAAPAP